MKFTQKQEKLLIFAMDPSVTGGELSNAATAFFRSLREQFGDGHKFLELLGGDDSPVMPFGKYKGQRIDQIPDTYLRCVLKNVGTISPSLRKDIWQILSVAEAEAKENAG